jgi:hypothetical protein
MTTIADEYGYDVDPYAETMKEPEERWRCEDDGAATWLLRKLAEVEAEMAANDQLAADEQARIGSWLRTVQGALEPRRAFFEGAACDYMRRRFEATGAVTVNLPTGTLTNRLGQPKVKVLDEERFVAWAIRQDRRDLLAITIKPALRELKAAIEPGDGMWYSTDLGDVAAAVEVNDAGELVAVVTYEGEKLTDDLDRWEPIPDGGAVLAPVDGGPALLVEAVTVEPAQRSPKAKAEQL